MLTVGWMRETIAAWSPVCPATDPVRVAAPLPSRDSTSRAATLMFPVARAPLVRPRISQVSGPWMPPVVESWMPVPASIRAMLGVPWATPPWATPPWARPLIGSVPVTVNCPVVT